MNDKKAPCSVFAVAKTGRTIKRWGGRVLACKEQQERKWEEQQRAQGSGHSPPPSAAAAVGIKQPRRALLTSTDP